MAIVLSGTTGIDAGSLPVSNCGNTEVEGNLNLSGVGARITGDFSNNTWANRLSFQNSNLNTFTSVQVLPNGTAASTSFRIFNSSSPDNSSFTELVSNETEARISSGYKVSGAALPLTVYTNNLERMRIDTAGNVGIGTIPSADYKLYTTPNYTGSASIGTVVIGASGVNYGSIGYNFRTTGTSYNYLYNASNSASMIRFESGGFNFLTAPTGTAGNTIPFNNAMTLDTSGNLLLTSGTGGLGYGTGAGGTVTQLTSKSTSVTLNKPSGRITMNNAALAAGATVSFVLVNNLMGSSDTLTLSIPNLIAYDTTNYRVVHNLWNGGASIFVTNVSGSTLSEAITINFNLHKGASA